MSFPAQRPRRLRQTATLRDTVRETHVRPTDLILPLFAIPGRGENRGIASMPGVSQQSADVAANHAKEAYAAGIPAVILFGVPATKDAQGSSGWDKNGPVPEAIKAIKDLTPELVVITDVCMCEYTDHGHCGALHTRKDAEVDVDNDATLRLLQKEAITHAEAGADMVAPSDMMDGRVGAIRQALDETGHQDVGIMSYAAKYASAFYGPFRDAAQSAPTAGPADRQTYQMDPANVREALREVRLDIEEGADIVMVKPALAYLDVIAKVRAATDTPVAAYNVSGEYAMLKNAATSGIIDENRAVLEVLLSIKRAGADLIITYHALQAARLLVP